MQREIAQLLTAWQQDRTDEERVLANVMAAIADLGAARQAFLDALDTAAKTMKRTPPPVPRFEPTDHAAVISEIIQSMRQPQDQRGYN